MSKHYFNSRLKIFSLNSNRSLTGKIADAVSVELGKYSVTQFGNGEIQANIEESICGIHVYVIQSTDSPANDSLMELLIVIDALKRVSAKTVNVAMPHYGYARQGHKARAREPTTAELVANMVEKASATGTLTLDLHAVRIQGFSDIPVDRLIGAPLVADYFIERGIQNDDVVVVPLDHGGVTRAHKLAEFLKASTAIIGKRCPKANVAEVISIIGRVEGKIRALVDDMIGATGTTSFTADALRGAGARGAYTSCTYPILSELALQRTEDSAIERLVITDSIYLSDDRKVAKTDEVSVGELIGDAVKRIHGNKLVSPLSEARNE